MASVQRYLKKNGLRGGMRETEEKDRKAFEEAYFGGMWQADGAYVLYGGEHYPLRLTDRVENGRTKRDNGLSIRYGKEGEADVH